MTNFKNLFKDIFSKKEITEATQDVTDSVSETIEKTEDLNKKAKTANKVLGKLTDTSKNATTGFGALATKIRISSTALGTFLAVGAGIIIAKKTWDFFNVTVAETEERIQKTNSKIEELNSEIKELENIGYRNSSQETRLNLLRDELSIQEQLLKVEEERRAKELTGRKFTDIFDPENISTQYNQDRYGINQKTGLLNIILDKYAKSNESWYTSVGNRKNNILGIIPKLFQTGLNKTTDWANEQVGSKDSLIQLLDDRVKAYEDAESKLEKSSIEENILDTISQLQEERLRYLENAQELQDGIDKGFFAKDSREADMVKWYKDAANDIENSIAPVQKTLGVFDFTDTFNGILDNYEGVNDKLVELYNSGDLTLGKLKELFETKGIKNNLSSTLNSDIIAKLQEAGLTAEEIYRIIQNLADPQKVWRDNTKKDFLNTVKGGSSITNAERWFAENGLDLNDETTLKAYVDIIGSTPKGTYEHWDKGVWLRKIQEQLNQNPIEVKGEFDIPQFSSDTEIFEGLQSLYESFRENVENGKLKNPLDIGDVQGLDDSLKALDSFKEFQETVLNGNSTVDEVQKAFDKLATEYANTKFQVDEITDANKDLIASQMELDGITKESARDFVEYYSSLNKIKDVKIDSSFIKNNSEELINDYREDENELLKEWTEGRYTDLEKLQSKYGNIDMDNRFLIEYNDKFLEANKEAMSTWEVETDEMGKVVSSYYTQIKDEIENGNYTIDTVYGGSDLFGDKNNLEISFSPILQTDDGAKFVAQNELYDYINNIINSAKQSIGENASESDLFNEIIKLDSEDGKKVGSAFGKGLISGITDTISGLSLDNLDAFDVGSLTHFSGDFGSVGAYEQYIEDFNKALEDSDVASATFLASIHDDETALQNLAEYLGVSIEQLALFSLQEQLADASNINTSDDVQALISLATQAGLTEEALLELKSVMDLLDQKAIAVSELAMHNGSIDYINKVKDLDNQIDRKLSEIKQKVNNDPKAILDPSKVKKSAGGAGKEAGDAYVDAFEKELKDLQLLKDSGAIDDVEFLKRYKALIEKYFKDVDKYAQKYTELMKDYRDQMKSLFDGVISGVTSLIDKKISKVQLEQETVIAQLEAEQKAAEEAYQAQIDAIDDEIDGLNDQIDALDDQIDKINDEIDALDDLIDEKQKVIDQYQEEIDAINDANDERQRAIDLQKAQYELERAQQQRTRLIYKNGQMQYVNDGSEIRAKKEDVETAQREIQIASIEKKIDSVQKEIDKIEEEKDALNNQIELIEKQKDAINDQIDALEKQKESIQEAMDEMNKYYDNLIDQQNKMFDELIKGLEKQKSKWEELAEADEIAKAYGQIQAVFGELGYSVEDVLNDVPGAFDAFSSQYMQLLYDMNSGNQSYIDGLNHVSDFTNTSFGNIKASAQGLSDVKQPLDDIATSMGEISTAASTAAPSVSTLATDAGTLNTNMTGLDEKISSSATSVTELQGAIDTLNGISLEGDKEESGGIISQFDNLTKSIGAAKGAIDGSAVEGSNSGEGEPKSGESDVEGGGLIGAIDELQIAAEEKVGSSYDTEAATVVGNFANLGFAVGEVSKAIGLEDGGDDTLVGVIKKLPENTEQPITTVKDLFDDLLEKINECVTAVGEIVSGLEKASSIEIGGGIDYNYSPTSPHRYGPNFTGTAYANGNWSAKSKGTYGNSLVGELGRELIVHNDGTYETVGDRGAEFTQVKPSDIVFNHKQTEDLLRNGHINTRGKAYANGNFTPLSPAELSKYQAFDEMDDIQTKLDLGNKVLTNIDKKVETIVHNEKTVNNNAPTINMNNTFTCNGVTVDQVKEERSNAFSGLLMNAYQKAMTK